MYKFTTYATAAAAAVAISLGSVLFTSGCAQPANDEPAGGNEAAKQTATPDPSPMSLVNAQTEAPVTPIETLSAVGIKAKIDEAQGTVTLLNFWATWCPPCVEEMPDHVKFYNEFGPEGVTYLSISADDLSTIDDAVKPFAKKFEMSFPVYVMTASNPTELDEAINLGWDGALPTTYLFNKQGEVVKTWVGEVSYETLATTVKPLLK